MKKIEQYLHLYLGCEVQLIKSLEDGYFEDNTDVPEVGSVGILSLQNNGGFNIYGGSGAEEWSYGVCFKDNSNITFWDAKDFKPILRPLSDKTQEEHDYVHALLKDRIINNLGNGDLLVTGFAEITAYLLSKHFDLFGLHEASLCLYKNDLK